MFSSFVQNDTSVSSLKDWLKAGAVLLDVRTHCEFAGYHIPGALNIPYDEIDRMKPFLLNLNGPVITYSTHGRRSRIAAQRLKALGVEVYNAGTLQRLASGMGNSANHKTLEHSS